MYMGCVWGRNGKNQEGSFVLLSWQSVTRGIHLRIAICLSTTPGFSPMPLIVIMSVGGASGAAGPGAGSHGGAPGRQRDARAAARADAPAQAAVSRGGGYGPRPGGFIHERMLAEEDKPGG